jgi:phage head maturation protease
MTIKAEIRADGLHISGYVNVPGRESRPVITPRGKVVEVIEQRAFQRALQKVDNIDLMVDHERKIASTKEGNLKVYEDEIGLRAEAVITDEEVIQGARQGKLKGWSFNMLKVVDEIEERAGKLPLRRVKDFIMTEITLALRKMPVYSATSIEIRAEEEEEVEIRTSECEITVKDLTEKKIDYSEFENKINKLKER